MVAGPRSIVASLSEHTSDQWLYAWALGYAAIGAASLLVPLYALERGGGPFIAGLLEATAGLAGIPGALLWGRLADRTGQRRAFVLVSLGGTGCSLAVFPLLDTIPLLIVANVVLWFMVAAATPVVTLFIIEHQPERKWEERIGLLNAYQRYGWVGGLLVGTVWIGVWSAQYSVLIAQQSFFLLCAGGALLAVPLAFYWLPPEATTRPGRFSRSQALQRLVTGAGRYMKLIPYTPGRAIIGLISADSRRPLDRFSRSLQRYFLVAFVFSVGAATFFGPVPAYLDELSYSSEFIFAFFILSSIASAIAFVPVGRQSASTSPKRLQAFALGTRVGLFPVIGLLAFVATVGLRTVAIAAGFLLVGLTWAVIAVTSSGIVSRTASASVRGEALGAFTALAGLGGGIGGVLGGVLARLFGYQVAFASAGLLVLVSLGLLLGTALPLGTPATEQGPSAKQD